MRTLSWAVVGAGRFATDRMVPVIASVPGSRVVGVWARDLDAAHGLAAVVGATTYPDFESLLSGRADIAYVAATPAAHPSLVESLLNAGIPVLCEKPLALTASDARRIAGLSRDLGVPCFVNHHLRANDCMVRVRDVLAAGTLGNVRTLKIENFQLMPQPPGWRASADAGGGVVRDLTVHDLDLVTYLLGAGPSLRTVSAVARLGDVETSVRLDLLGPGGTVVSLSDGWVAPPGAARSRLEIVADHGSVVVDPAVTATGSSIAVTTGLGTVVGHQVTDAYAEVARLAADAVRGESVALTTAKGSVATLSTIEEILNRLSLPAASQDG